MLSWTGIVLIRLSIMWQEFDAKASLANPLEQTECSRIFFKEWYDSCVLLWFLIFSPEDEQSSKRWILFSYTIEDEISNNLNIYLRLENSKSKVKVWEITWGMIWWTVVSNLYEIRNGNVIWTIDVWPGTFKIINGLTEGPFLPRKRTLSRRKEVIEWKRLIMLMHG